MRNKDIILILVAITALLMTACTRGAPDLVLDLAEEDIGEVVNGEVRMLEVPIQNEGNAPLVIEAVTTSCGCTTAEVEPSTIGPGENGLLLVTYDSGAHGPDEVGPIMRQVFIASNDPDQPEVEFRILAEVLPPES